MINNKGHSINKRDFPSGFNDDVWISDARAIKEGDIKASGEVKSPFCEEVCLPFYGVLKFKLITACNGISCEGTLYMNLLPRCSSSRFHCINIARTRFKTTENETTTSSF